jgi:hypothetical protein
MEIQRLRRLIAQFQVELLNMNKSRNWYRYQYPWATGYFFDHSIVMPWGSETPTATQDMDATTTSDDEIEPPAERLKRCIHCTPFKANWDSPRAVHPAVVSSRRSNDSPIRERWTREIALNYYSGKEPSFHWTMSSRINPSPWEGCTASTQLTQIIQMTIERLNVYFYHHVLDARKGMTELIVRKFLRWRRIFQQLLSLLS